MKNEESYILYLSLKQQVHKMDKRVPTFLIEEDERHSFVCRGGSNYLCVEGKKKEFFAKDEPDVS